MPADRPLPRSPVEVNSLCAYVLYLGDIIPAEPAMGAQMLAEVVMPNRAHFPSPDPRPDLCNTGLDVHMDLVATE